MIRTLAVSLALLCWVPQAGWAFDFPALYHVIDVADDDVLNVRAQPDAQSAIIGTLLHDEADVEVMALSDDGKWGLINVGENAGWVAIRFLQHSGAPDRPCAPDAAGQSRSGAYRWMPPMFSATPRTDRSLTGTR